MKKIVLLALAMLVFGIAAQAQSQVNGKFEVYGGYTYQFSSKGSSSPPSLPPLKKVENLNGFHVGGTYWLDTRRKFGLTGEYSFTVQELGNTAFFERNVVGDNTRNNLVAGGFTYRLATGRVKPFIHALVGANRSHTRAVETVLVGPIMPRTFTSTATSFSKIAGGGLDIDLKKNGRLALRAGALDYQVIAESSQSGMKAKGLRFSTGLVVRF